MKTINFLGILMTTLIAVLSTHAALISVITDIVTGGNAATVIADRNTNAKKLFGPC